MPRPRSVNSEKISPAVLTFVDGGRQTLEVLAATLNAGRHRVSREQSIALEARALANFTSNQLPGLKSTRPFCQFNISVFLGFFFVDSTSSSFFSRRTTCLKYLVLANMLMKSGINPFDSQEAKPYKNNPEILAMTNLVR